MAELSALELLAADEDFFWDEFIRLYAVAQRGLPPSSEVGARWTAGGRRIGAHELFAAVQARGGFQVCCLDKSAWWSIAEGLGIPVGLAGTLSYQVRELYSDRFLQLEVTWMGRPATAIPGSDRSLRARPSNTTGAGPSQQPPPAAAAPPPPPPTSLPAPAPTPTPPIAPTYTTTSTDMAGQQQTPMHTFVVDTPSNRRGVFSQVPEDSASLPAHVEPALASMIPEKTPRIYNHCVRGLESGIPREVDFALHHLVIISDERGDKFRFRDFPMLAENLTEKILEISKVVYGVEWDFDDDYPDPAKPKPTKTLNTAVGTYDLLERLQKLPVLLEVDQLEDERLANDVRLVKEASLVLRNMCMLDENAQWLNDIETVRDCATIVLRLPKYPRFEELKNNMLDVVQQACPYWPIWENDPLYITLIEYLDSNDRFQILAALKSLTMFALDTEEEKRLVNIPMSKIDTLMNLYLLVQDSELLSAILDFFYQYTAVRSNVEALTAHVHLPTTVIRRMTNLLTFDSDEDEVVYNDVPERKAPPPKEIQMPPPDLYVQLMQLTEPERTARWLKCCFVEDTECEVTQLALWHAYQNCFAEIRVPGVHNLGTLQATDFISTVTNTFPPAEAKIVEGPSAKFIIKGIRPLETIYNFEGYPYHFCQWATDSPSPCNHIYLDPKDLQTHVYRDHLGLDSAAPGGWDLTDTSKTATCFWGNCNQYRVPHPNIARVAGHVTLHMPPAQDMSAPPPVPGRPVVKPALSRVFDYYPTPIDENGEPYGIAYKALLILRNIQRNLPTGSAGREYDNLSWTRAMFLSIRTTLIETADLNPSLRREIFELVSEIDRS